MRYRPACLAIVLLASAVPAKAETWRPMGFRQSKFVFEAPPDFFLARNAVQGQGAMFHGPAGETLAVWGADLARSEFRAQIAAQIAQDESDGWNITYRRVTSTWASYSGIKDGQIRYFRAISACGDKAAAFILDYARSAKVAFDPIVVRLVRGLKEEGCRASRPS